MPRKLTDDDRFDRIMVTDDCWIWMGASASGYGYAGAGVLAHRWAYEYWNGAIPEGCYVCHKCDVPLCVNPDHLWIGDAKTNMVDKVSKGRGNKARLSADQVRAIRSDGRTQQAIADSYGVNQCTISEIKTGRTYRWVE